MGQSGSVGSHTVKVWRSEASAFVRSLLACGALMPPPASTVKPMSILSCVLVSSNFGTSSGGPAAEGSTAGAGSLIAPVGSIPSSSYLAIDEPNPSDRPTALRYRRRTVSIHKKRPGPQLDALDTLLTEPSVTSRSERRPARSPLRRFADWTANKNSLRKAAGNE